MFQLRATSARSWQAISRPSQVLHRSYSVLRDPDPPTASSPPESTDTTTAGKTADKTTSKRNLLISRLSQRNATRQTDDQSFSRRRRNFEAKLVNEPNDRGTQRLGANQSLLTRRKALDADVELPGHGAEPLQHSRGMTARSSGLDAEVHVEPEGFERIRGLRANRSPYTRRRTSELDGRGMETYGATSFLSAESAKSRDHAATKWLTEGEEDLEGFIDGDEDEHEYEEGEDEYEDEDEFDEEENRIEVEEDEEFLDDPIYDLIDGMDKMSEEQVAEWERVTWPKTIQKLRDQNTAEREAVAAATHTDLKELFGPVSAPHQSPRLQALKELGGDYSSYLPQGDAVPRKYPLEYARLALGRNKQIPLDAQTEALRVIEASIGGRVTKTGKQLLPTLHSA